MSWFGCTDDDRCDEVLRATDSRENARSNAPCLFEGDSLRPLAEPVGESGAEGEPIGEMGFEDERGDAGLLSGGSHLGLRDGVTGTVMRAWITWIIGEASGAGNVGGKVLNRRNNGGRILSPVISRSFHAVSKYGITHPSRRSLQQSPMAFRPSLPLGPSSTSCGELR